jgi:hypothetical protein
VKHLCPQNKIEKALPERNDDDKRKCTRKINLLEITHRRVAFEFNFRLIIFYFKTAACWKFLKNI